MDYFINKLKTQSLTLCTLATATLIGSAISSTHVMAADYPANIDYGSQGDFIVKRGVEFGRTADLLPIGPVLINLPEGPGSSPVALPNGVRFEDTAWDLSDLTNPQMIRSLTCDTCFPGQPIGAHATVIRFDPDNGPSIYTRASNYSFDPSGATSNDQLVSNHGPNNWRSEPLSYINLTSPYYVRTYWDYGFEPSGQYAIRDLNNIPTPGPNGNYTLEGTPWENILGGNELGIWLGTPFVYWNHLGLTGVTGFSSWLGDLLVVASDQQATGMAIYDVSGFKEGRIPRLLSTYQPELTEPDGHKVGIGGYWVESYGTHKMVYATRARRNVIPERSYPAMYVVDFSDPTNPQLSCELYFDQDKNDPSDGDDSSDPMYINFQDQYAFVDHFKVDIDACEAAYDDKTISSAEFSQIVYKFSDIDNQCDASQYFRPLGQVGVFGGYDWWVTSTVNEQGMCFFVTDDEPDSRPPYIAGHSPAANRTDYPVDGLIHMHIPETLRTETVQDSVTLTNVTAGTTETFRMQLSHTGILSVWPDQYLAADSEYRVDVVGIQDYMGNTMTPYSFTFNTNNGVVTGPDGDDGSNAGEIIPSYQGTAYYPNKSSQLSCQTTAENGDIWVVNPDNDSVSVISQNADPVVFGVSPTFKQEIKLHYQKPTSVTDIFRYGSHRFAVTYQDDDKVVFLRADGNPEFSIDTGHGSQPIASVYSDHSLYVALYGSGEVIEIDLAEREIVARLKVGPTPKAMALSGQRLLVTRFISTMDEGEVYDIDISAGLALTRTITINKVTVPDDIDHGTGVPNYLSSIVISQDGTSAYVTASKANIDRGLQRNGLPLDGDNTIRPMIATLDLVNNRDANTDPSTRDDTTDLDNGADPSAITFLANPDVRVHALQGNNIVVANNLAGNTSGQFATGLAPQDMCATLRTLYVKNFSERSVSAIDVAGFLYDGRLDQNITTVNTVTEEVLSSEELLGLQQFYHSSMPEMGPEGYMTCASCHAGGGHDGMTWDITSMGEGLRNTLSLNGASGTRFGNLHWTGNFDEVQDFEIQMEQLNGGEGLISGKTFGSGDTPLNHISSGLSSELDALAAYINGLGKDTVSRSPHRDYTGRLTEAAQRGQTVFAQQGCGSCHSTDAYRDGQSHDVGTITAASGNRLGGPLSAIRTPSLIELWASAPYFHDGSAATLEDVLARGDHQRAFSGTEQADLIEFLRSIDRELYIDDAP